MDTEAAKDELIFAGRATICEYIETNKYKMIRFSGPVLNRDWEFVRDLYGFLKGLQGACIVDLSEMPDFDATLYSILIWMRILAASRSVRFLVVAGGGVEARLKASGVGKWMPIISDLSVFSRMAAKRDGDGGRVSMPPPIGLDEGAYSSRSVV